MIQRHGQSVSQPVERHYHRTERVTYHRITPVDQVQLVDQVRLAEGAGAKQDIGFVHIIVLHRRRRRPVAQIGASRSNRDRNLFAFSRSNCVRSDVTSSENHS